MRYPVNNWDNWYIAQGFGVQTSYGYHEGDDINLKSGGDSDLGQPLLAIADGQITSIHSHITKPTFGIHLHLKINTPFGERWAHYAHCNKVYVEEGSMVIEGQPIAEVGKTGTDVAHCHFAIKKQPTGIDGIAKTKEDLLKWENPIKFIEDCIAVINEGDEIESLKRQINSLNDQIVSLKGEIIGTKESLIQQTQRYNTFINQLWEKLKPTGSKNESTILGEVEKLIGVEDQIEKLKQENVNITKKYDEQLDEHIDKLANISLAHTTLQKDYNVLKVAYSDLQATKKPHLTIIEWLTYWFIKGGE